MSCVAFGCYNKSSKKKIAGVTYHRFPKDAIRRAEWVKAVRRADWTPSYCSVLCSEHFKESDFDRTPFRTILKPNAVPSKFKGYQSSKVKQEKSSASCDPVTSSPPPKQGPSDKTFTTCFEIVESTDEIAVDQNKPKGIRRKNNFDKNTVVVVPDTDDYTDVLNGPSDANRTIVISDKLTKRGPSSSALARMGNARSTNDKVAAKNLTINKHGNKDLKKIMVVVVPGSPAHKHLLKSNPSEYPGIVVPDRLIHNKRLDSSLSKTRKTRSGSAVSEAASEQTGRNKRKNKPIIVIPDEVLSQRRKELEEVVKKLFNKKKILTQRIRRAKKFLKKLRNKYIRFNKKNPTILPRTSQPVVHFLARDVQNV